MRKARITYKYDTLENYQNSNFIPLKSQLIFITPQSAIIAGQETIVSDDLIISTTGNVGIKIGDGENKASDLNFVFSEMDNDTIDSLTINKSSHINLVLISINTDGGVYNNGLGYKNGYRVRSTGEETAVNGAYCTGFIPVNAGDVVRIYGWNSTDFSGSGTSINASDSSKTNIGQLASNGNYGIFNGDYQAYNFSSVVHEDNEIYRWTVPPAASGVAYIRISGYSPSGRYTGKDLIVTINEEIEL